MVGDSDSDAVLGHFVGLGDLRHRLASVMQLPQPLNGNSVHGRVTEAPQRVTGRSSIDTDTAPALPAPCSTAPAGASASRNDDMPSQSSAVVDLFAGAITLRT